MAAGIPGHWTVTGAEVAVRLSGAGMVHVAVKVRVEGLSHALLVHLAPHRNPGAYPLVPTVRAGDWTVR